MKSHAIRSRQTVLALGLLLLLSHKSSNAAEISWSGGTGSDWNVASNWLPFFDGERIVQRVPGDGDIASLVASRTSGSAALSSDAQRLGGLRVGGGMMLRTNGFQMGVVGEPRRSTVVNGERSVIVVTPVADAPKRAALTTDFLSVAAAGHVQMAEGVLTVNVGATLSAQGSLSGSGNVQFLNTPGRPESVVLTNDGSIALDRSRLVLSAPAGGKFDLDGSSEDGAIVVGPSSQLAVLGRLSEPFGGRIEVSTSSTLELSDALELEDAGRLFMHGGIALNFVGRIVAPEVAIYGQMHVNGAGIFESDVYFAPLSTTELADSREYGTTLNLFGSKSTIAARARFTGHGKLLVDRGGRLHLESGAQVDVAVNVKHALMTLEGGAAIRDEYRQHRTGSLQVDVGGTEPGTHDHLLVKGDAILDGTLIVELEKSYIPNRGHTFEVLQAEGSVKGTFASVDAPELPDDLGWRVVYNADDVHLMVVDSVDTERGLVRIGDCNQDGDLDVSDPICTLLHLFGGGGKELPCGDGTASDNSNVLLLDVNDDDALDLSDAIYVLGYLFADGPEPAGGVNCIRVEGCTSTCSFTEPE